MLTFPSLDSRVLLQETEGGEEESGEGNANEVALEVGEAGEADEEEEEEEANGEQAQEEETEAEEKLWASVDKDLGELLRDVEPEEEERAKSSDDDESVVESGRYDRFRNSEKNKQKLASKSATNGEEPVSNTQDKE